jgi:nitrite reductase (NADH) small subunit
MPTRAREYIVAEAASIPVGTHRVVKVEKREIGIFNIDGTLYALPNLCPHQIGPLCRGKVSGTLIANAGTGWKPEWVHDGEIITCPWHGLEYHVPTGQCIAFPEIRLRTYEVWRDENVIKLRI